MLFASQIEINSGNGKQILGGSFTLDPVMWRMMQSRIERKLEKETGLWRWAVARKVCMSDIDGAEA